MPYCVNCGVELDPEAGSCPLCQTPLPGRTPPRESPGAERVISALDPEDREKLSDAEARVLVWELLTVSLGIGGAVLAAVDLLGGSGFGWSLYPLASIALAWALLSLGLRRPRPDAIRVALAALAPPAYLAALDAIDGGLSWSLRVAIPICFAAELAAGAAAAAIARTPRRGANAVAFGLVGAAATCFAIEAILDLAAGGPLSLGWSAIVLAALLPISAFLLYLHHRILGKRSLRRYFRL